MGRVKIGTLRVGPRAKEGKRGGEKKIRLFLFSLPAPYPAHFDSPHFVFEFQHACFNMSSRGFTVNLIILIIVFFQLLYFLVLLLNAFIQQHEFKPLRFSSRVHLR